MAYYDVKPLRFTDIRILFLKNSKHKNIGQVYTLKIVHKS